MTVSEVSKGNVPIAVTLVSISVFRSPAPPLSAHLSKGRIYTWGVWYVNQSNIGRSIAHSLSNRSRRHWCVGLFLVLVVLLITIRNSICCKIVRRLMSCISP